MSNSNEKQLLTTNSSKKQLFKATLSREDVQNSRSVWVQPSSGDKIFGKFAHSSSTSWNACVLNTEYGIAVIDWESIIAVGWTK